MEQHYVVYDDSGEIVQWGIMSEDALAYDASLSGKKYVLGLGLPYSHRVDLATLTIVPREHDDSTPQTDT